MRPLEEQVILVTGSTDGLGRARARELADRGATVLLHARNRANGEATLRELRAATGNDRTREALAHPQAYDVEARRRLRALSAGLVGLA